MRKTEHWREFSTNSGRLTAGWLPLLWPCRVIDAGAPFVKATYTLEGDGLLVFQTYSTLQALATAAAQHHYPNVAGQASALGETPEEVANLTAFAREGVQPGVTYFLQKFNAIAATSKMSCEHSGQREWRVPWQRRNCSLMCRMWSSSRCFHAWMTTPSHDWKSTGGAPGLPRWNRGR